MVGMGMGLSFLPGLFVHASLGRDASVKPKELKGRALYRTVGMVWRKTSARKGEFETLAGHVRDAVKRGFPKVSLA